MNQSEATELPVRVSFSPGRPQDFPFRGTFGALARASVRVRASPSQGLGCTPYAWVQKNEKKVEDSRKELLLKCKMHHLKTLIFLHSPSLKMVGS